MRSIDLQTLSLTMIKELRDRAPIPPGKIVASAVMSYMGVHASYNLGDPTRLEFVLVPLWQVGLGVGVVGGVLLPASRRVNGAP